MSVLLNYRDLKESLKPLSGYAALRAAVSARVEAFAPRPSLAEIEAESNGILALGAAFVGYRSVKRTAIKAHAWHRVASILAGVEAEAGDEWAEIDAAAQAMVETSTAAIAAGVKALEEATIKTAESMPAINEEVF